MEFFWEKQDWTAQDPHLQALKSAPFRRSFPNLKLESGLYVIRGPRQIGKSSWLKTLLSKYPNPRRAFYLSCEQITSHQELGELLKSLRQKRDLIMLDEISFIPDWSRAVKHELDSGYSGTLIVTGSHSFDLRRGMDQMPGRFGKGGEYFLMPMLFEEYCQMRRQAGWPDLDRNSSLQAFFTTGGFPLAVIQGGPDGHPPKEAKETYLRWLRGDVLKLGKLEIYLREILSQIARTMTTPISLQKLAQRTQIGSHHTALDYVSLLEDCFAVRTCFAIDPNTNAFRSRKEKKFYFTDPLLYWIALEWAGFEPPQDAMNQIAEMVAHEALYRKCRLANLRLGYFSSPKGEIDFFCPDHFVLEVKWSDVAQRLSKAYLQFVGPEKIVWTKHNFLDEWPSSLVG